MNRLSRDQILHQALDLADLASLDQHDRPRGVIVENAHSVSWLQAGLDLAHHLWPVAGLLTEHPIVFVAGTGTYDLATDHIEDKRDGLIIGPGSSGTATQGRALRKNMDTILDWDAQTQVNPTQLRGVPRIYVCKPAAGGGATGGSLLVRPIPDRAYAGTLHYYAVPNIMENGLYIPTFPSDFMLIEYVHLRAKEHSHVLDAGASIKYMTNAVGALQRAGLGNEAELQGPVPLDRGTFGRMRDPGPADWMGDTVPH